LGKDSTSPRARHRFGFTGPPTSQKRDRVTADDILDSLTRQAEIRQKLGDRDHVRFEDIVEMEDQSQFQGFGPEAASRSPTRKERNLGHIAFVFMLLVGLTVVWLYSSISNRFDLALLIGIIQKSGVQSVFANQAQLGIIAMAALLGALWIRHRRRGSSLHLLSN